MRRALALSRNGYGPLVLGATLVALGLVAWRTLVQPRMPAEIWNAQRVAPVSFCLPGASTPFWRYGALHADGLLVAGDSRVSAALLQHVLAEEGLPRTAVVMGPMGQLRDLVAVARSLPQRRLVLALSPLSLSAPETDEARRRLDRELALTWTARLDEHAGRSFALARRRLARPLEPRAWESGWFWRAVDDGEQPYYERLLGPDTRAEREARYVALERDLEALVRDGWRVACVRLPVAPRLRAIEEQAFPGARFAELCARARVPYLDHSAADHRTTDGSHLTAAAAQDYSRAFARALRAAAPEVAGR